MEVLQGSFIVISFILWGSLSRLWVGDSPTNKVMRYICKIMTGAAFILILHLLKVV